tara:strand:+ start:7798 stop:8190 length:393 start_codon:yes stop_codon:yes gene_type:complete
MPLYDIICPTCGLVEDVICSVEERNTCPECAGEAQMKPIMPMSVGIIWSNAEVSDQLGRTFETNKQKREWLKAHPRVEPMDKGSREDRDFGESIQEKADKAAQRYGFKDKRQYQAEIKKKQNPTPKIMTP